MKRKQKNAIEPCQMSRCEIALITSMLLFGVAVRIVFPSRMSVEHYDEGVYSSSLWFGVKQYYEYPQLHLYAPPLLPGLIEWSLLVLGPRAGPMAPSLLAGCLTLLLLWWTARRWFGPEEALAALTLAGFSDIHQIFCRTALTDTLLTFWLLLALFLFAEAIRRPKLVLIVASGLATGLAWWTKYSGWLPLAIGLGGVLLWTVLERRAWMNVRTALLVWLGVAVITSIVWCKVFITLVTKEALAAVMFNHQLYVVGLVGWLDSFNRQVQNLWYLDSWMSCSGITVALLSATMLNWCQRPRADTSSERSAWLLVFPCSAAVALTAVATLLGSSVTLTLMSLIGIFVLLRGIRRQLPASNRSLEASLLAAWFVGLFLVTPTYYAYSRLTLPWLASIWLGGGVAIAHLVRWSQGLGEARATLIRYHPLALGAVTACLVLSLGVLVWRGPHLTRKGIPALENRTGFEPIARQIDVDVKRVAETNPYGRSGKPEIYTYGDPALFFHLKAAGVRRVAPIFQMMLTRDTSVPTFLVTGPHAHRTKEYAIEWQLLSDRYSQVATYPYVPSDLVRLDLYDPRELQAGLHREPEEVRLYVLK